MATLLLLGEPRLRPQSSAATRQPAILAADLGWGLDPGQRRSSGHRVVSAALYTWATVPVPVFLLVPGMTAFVIIDAILMLLYGLGLLFGGYRREPLAGRTRVAKAKVPRRFSAHSAGPYEPVVMQENEGHLDAEIQYGPGPAAPQPAWGPPEGTGKGLVRLRVRTRAGGGPAAPPPGAVGHLAGVAVSPCRDPAGHRAGRGMRMGGPPTAVLGVEPIGDFRSAH